MIINHPFQFQTAQTVDQVFDILQSQPGSALLAGGSDFIPLLKYGLKQPTQLIGLDQIPYLNRIEQRKEGLFIGAMNRLVTLVEDPQINLHCAILSDAARLVASPQIRNMGTIGGKVLNLVLKPAVRFVTKNPGRIDVGRFIIRIWLRRLWLWVLV